MTAQVHSTAAGASPQPQRLPVAGKVRPGIKVITSAASNDPAMKAEYEEGLRVGASFDDIEKAMRKAAPKYTRRPLTPRNVPYFRVHQSDFTTPGAAARIIDLYGEQRDGDPEPRLYAFPVVFPVNDISIIFREQFEAWSASKLRYWSEPDLQTGQLMCKQREELKKGGRRRFGPRPVVTLGPCDPNACDTFDAGECNHSGSLYFWIPGISGAGVIELEFKSIYASLSIRETLELISQGLGRINGLTKEGKPIFWVTKRQQEVSMLDHKAGEAKRQSQWIIQLDASGLDMTAVLTGETAPAIAAPEQRPQLAAPAEVQPEVVTGAVEREPEQPAAPANPDEVKALRRSLGELTGQLGWTREETGEWILQEYGSQEAAHNPEQLADMIGKLRDHLEFASGRDTAATAPTANEGGNEPKGGNDAPF